MPIYEYQCHQCNHQFEVLQKVSDASISGCPECGQSDVKKLVSATSFRLKGSGWYETDFKSKPEDKSLSNSNSSDAKTNETMPKEKPAVSDKS
tara:strand:+ start:742 stop:1020 length:279 start_codon:yes stop_codon:yes gene_type:complete